MPHNNRQYFPDRSIAKKKLFVDETAFLISIIQLEKIEKAKARRRSI
jgi:hypothetical protein